MPIMYNWVSNSMDRTQDMLVGSQLWRWTRVIQDEHLQEVSVLRKVVVVFLALCIGALVAGCGGDGGDGSNNGIPAVGTLVGAWDARTGSHIAAVFLSTSRYVTISPDAVAHEELGFELGNYTLTSDTGIFTPTTILDLDGSYGLPASGQLGIYFRTADGDLRISAGGVDYVNYARVSSTSNPIVGAWYQNGADIDLGDHEEKVFVALADGHFYAATFDVTQDNGARGIEYGTYTWDQTTHAFAINATVDANGEAGFSNYATGTTATVASNTLTLTKNDHGDVFHRVGN